MIIVFEIDIRTAAVDGVMLHERDGTPYWKLVKVCPECKTLMDDECMCFSTEEAMLKAKDQVFYCSARCWFPNLPEERQKDEREEFLQAADNCLWTLHGDELRQMSEEDFHYELMEYIEEKWEDSCDMSMSEYCDADLECPI